MADAYAVIGTFGGDAGEFGAKSKAAAAKALELDPTLARPHADLGLIKMQYDWDFAGGEAEFRKAFEIDPSDATAHQWFAQSLCYMGGRAQDAIEEGNRARLLDPLSPIIAFAQAEAYAYDRQYDKAIEMYKKAIADNPTFSVGHIFLSYAYWGEHKYPQIIQEYQTYAQLSGDKNNAEFTAALDSGFRSGGWPNAAHKGIEVLTAQYKAKTDYLAPYQIAELYGDIGDKDHNSNGLTPHTRNAASWSPACGPTPRSIRCAPIHGIRNWCARSVSRNSHSSRTFPVTPPPHS